MMGHFIMMMGPYIILKKMVRESPRTILLFYLFCCFFSIIIYFDVEERGK